MLVPMFDQLCNDNHYKHEPLNIIVFFMSCDSILEPDWHAIFLCMGNKGPIHICPDPFLLFALEGAGHDTIHVPVASKITLCSLFSLPVHPSCYNLSEVSIKVLKSYPWQCLDCKTCQVMHTMYNVVLCELVHCTNCCIITCTCTCMHVPAIITCVT